MKTLLFIKDYRYTDTKGDFVIKKVNSHKKDNLLLVVLLVIKSGWLGVRKMNTCKARVPYVVQEETNGWKLQLQCEIIDRNEDNHHCKIRSQ